MYEQSTGEIADGTECRQWAEVELGVVIEGGVGSSARRQLESMFVEAQRGIFTAVDV